MAGRKLQNHGEWDGHYELHSEQVGMEFGISALLRPKVQWYRSKFVDERLGKAILSQVNGLDVGLAGIAALDADVGKRFGSVHGKLGMVFLAASGTNDAAELPFAKAEAAKQVAAASITLRAQDCERRLAIAERAQGMGVALELQPGVRAGIFGVRLQKGKGEKFFRPGRRLVSRRPTGVQHI